MQRINAIPCKAEHALGDAGRLGPLQIMFNRYKFSMTGPVSPLPHIDDMTSLWHGKPPLLLHHELNHSPRACTLRYHLHHRRLLMLPGSRGGACFPL